MTLLAEICLVLVGLGAGWWLARTGMHRVRLRGGGERSISGPSVRVGDPLFDWVMRANDASGLWVLEPSGDVRGGAAGGVVEEPEIFRRRIEALGQGGGEGDAGVGGDRSGVERVGPWLFGYVAKPPLAAGMLLSGTRDATVALQDLHGLLAHCASLPILRQVQHEQGRMGESVESIAVRLAHQIETLLDAAVVIVLRRPRGVEVMGVGLRTDHRLQGLRAEPGSALAQVATGEAAGTLLAYDPLGSGRGVGGDGQDRRLADRRAVVYPIDAADERIGAVAIWTLHGDEVSGPEGQALTQALRAAGPRLADAIARREERDEATHDPLTGLRNRRGFAEAIGQIAVRRAALVYADLDHFKRLNDTLGHAAGDAALVHFAAIVGKLVRGRDAAGRVGGEEFAIWLPDATLERGCAVADRIRCALVDAAWHWQGRPWDLTASFGVAAWPETTSSRNNLPAQADAALYYAKRSGRNRVAAVQPGSGDGEVGFRVHPLAEEAVPG